MEFESPLSNFNNNSIYLHGITKTYIKMQATGFWVVLKDPREHTEKKESLLHIPEEVQAQIDNEELNKSIETNVLEVISVGVNVGDKKIQPGCKVAVDPRQPALILPTEEETYLVVADTQVIGVV